MRWHPFNYLSIQLVFATVIPILIVSSVISIPMITVWHEHVLEQAHLRLSQAGRTTEAIYAERLTSAMLFAELLAERPILLQVLRRGHHPDIQQFVQQIRGDTLFDLVTVVDSSGNILAQDGDTSFWRPDQIFSDTPTLWNIPGVGLINQISTPIDDQGVQFGRLIGTFALGEAFLLDMRTSTETDQSIFSTYGLVVSSLAHRQTADMPTLHPTSVLGTRASHSTQVTKVTIDAIPYLAAYAPLHHPYGQPIGTLEVLLPLEPIKAAQHQATITLLTITLSAVLAATFPGWILIRRLSRPVQQLADAAEAMGRDGLTQPVDVSGPMEVRILTQAIERMRQQLSETYCALEAEKARYANILESVEEAILTLDTDECVTSLNRSAEQLLGWTRTSAYGYPLYSIVNLEQGEALTLDRIPPVGTIHLTIRTSEAQVLTVSATRSRSITSIAGWPDEHIVVLRDISEEAALGRLKEEFLANITHEFRTPLSALMASLEILREDGDELSPPERQHMLTTIHTGVQRLDTLVRNLLDSASLQAGYFHVDPTVECLSPLILEAMEMMRPLLSERAQKMALTIPDEVPLVIADGRRIVQVLINLLSNASKFGPRGDTIQITIQVEPTEVEVAVIDHGPGVPADRQLHLFQRFLRPGTSTVRAQGIGLGLAIVKAIIERHGGQVRMRSPESQGTTFAFTLPCASENANKQDLDG